jgi:hypothetical protein
MKGGGMMILSKCPGQDTRYWTADDIHEQPCPHCGETIEFWKTDIRVRCPHCKQKAVNPRFNLGCAEWCAYAEQCLGSAGRGIAPQPLRQVLGREISRLLHGLPLQLKELKKTLVEAEEKCRELKIDPLPILTAMVVLGAGELGRLHNADTFLHSLADEHHFPPEALTEAKKILANLTGDNLRGEREGLVANLFDKNRVLSGNGIKA